jgi:hypothetical protein
MGLTRKLLSVSTLGAVDMRSDKERTARYTQATKKEAKKQTELLRQQTRAAQQAAAAAQRQPVAQAVPQQSAPPPGFFHDPKGGQFLRWWDGVQWTDMTQPLAPRPGEGS